MHIGVHQLKGKRPPGLREEGKLADTERFHAIRDLLAASAEEGAEPEIVPEDTPDLDPQHSSTRREHNVKYYSKLRKYLKALDIVNDADEVVKQISFNYELRDGVLYHSELGTSVVIMLEDLKSIIEAVHKDLGHYGKRTTLEGVRQRYVVGSDLWEEGGKVLNSCIPCQLYKRPAKTADNATIHPYGAKDPFQLWEIDFVGKLIKIMAGNRYIITAIDYATSTAIAWALEERSADIAIELLKDII